MRRLFLFKPQVFYFQNALRRVRLGKDGRILVKRPSADELGQNHCATRIGLFGIAGCFDPELAILVPDFHAKELIVRDCALAP